MRWWRRDGAGAGRLPRVVRIAVLVLVGYVAVPVALTEVAFRLYERHVLTKRLPPPGPDGVLDLSRLGYSNGPVAPVKPAGEARILSLGDSFAYGIVTDTHNYNRVARAPSRRGHGPGVLHRQPGPAEQSFPDYQRELELWSRVLPHEAVILDIYAGNDFVEAAAMPAYLPGELEGSLAVALSTGVQVPRRYPLRIMDHAYALYLSWATRGEPAAGYRATTRMSWDRYVQVMAGTAHAYRRAVPGRDWRELAPSYVRLRDLLARLEAERAAGVATLVLVAAAPAVSERVRRDVSARTGVPESALDFSLPGRLVRAVAEVAGYRGAVYDLLPCLCQHAKAGMDLYRGTDTHWSVEGNRVVGDFLADLLGREWPRARAAERASPCDPEAALAPRDDEVLAFTIGRPRRAPPRPRRRAARAGHGSAPWGAASPPGVTRIAAPWRAASPASGSARRRASWDSSIASGRGARTTWWAGRPTSARARPRWRSSRSWMAPSWPRGAQTASDRTCSARSCLAPAPSFRPGFEFAAPGACAASRRAEGLWMLAVSAARTYAWLGPSGPIRCG